ncbi:MAG TPA: ATP-binding protein [Planctomycetota bacterium]|nr:ATP-binding protein [Planctomycetota bacterium]
MLRTSDFRRRIKIGFALVGFLAGAISFVSLYSLRSVIESKDQVISDYARNVVLTRDLELAAEQVAASSRAYLLTGDPRYLKQGQTARTLYRTRIELLRSSAVLPEENGLLDQALDAAFAHQQALDEAISAETKAGDPKEVAEFFEATVHPRSKRLREALYRLVSEKDRRVNEAVDRSRRGADLATILVATLGGAAAVLAGALFLASSRTLRRLERAEAEIQNLNEHLEQRVIERTREIEGFAYSIAHDLRSPLRAMAGWGDVVLTDYGSALDETGRDALTRIRKAALRMDDLIGGLLGLARFSYESFPLSPIDVGELLKQTLASVEPEIAARGARIEVESIPVHALAHPFLAKLAIGHLVSNGLKFVAPNVVPHLLLATECRGNRVRIRVTDNGIGIPAQYHARIFGMFERLHPSDAYPGIGVGLTLAQRAAHRMGGSIGVDSVPGNGSVFWIELAAAKAGDEATTTGELAGTLRL